MGYKSHIWRKLTFLLRLLSSGTSLAETLSRNFLSDVLLGPRRPRPRGVSLRRADARLRKSRSEGALVFVGYGLLDRQYPSVELAAAHDRRVEDRALALPSDKAFRNELPQVRRSRLRQIAFRFVY